MEHEIRVDLTNGMSYSFDAENVRSFHVEDGALFILDEENAVFALFAAGQWLWAGKVESDE